MASCDPVFVESVEVNSTVVSFTKSSYELSEVHSYPDEKSSEECARTTALSASERVKIRCSPRSCQVRWVRSKGAILILLWNCLIANNYGPLSKITAGVLSLYTDDGNLIGIANTVIQGLSFVLLYPIAGWIADVYFGRYKVIRTSLQLMWAGVIVIAACFCIHVSTGIGLALFQYGIFPVAVLAIECGTAGFKANAIQFGTDQLMEGSSNELSAYIHWYIFTIYFNIRVLSVPCSCFGEDSESALILQLLVQAACLSLALCLDFCLKGWLIIDPGTKNPFKTIYKVLSYARKNKHAKFRSAFTYHVENIPSRIELSKPQYGGPFTVEEVEDVKTFFRMLFILIPMGIVIIMGISARMAIDVLANHIPSEFNCVTKDVFGSNFPLLLILVLLALYELFLYPLLHNLVPSMMVRVGIGTLFIIASLLAQLALDTIGHLHSNANSASSYLNDTNVSTSTCIFTDGSVDLEISYLWTILPGTLLALGRVTYFTAIYEFVFAQAPYSMKGLFIGLIYGMQGFFQLITLTFDLPFLLGAADNSLAFPTCGFFYFLMNIVVTAVALLWYSCVAWKYKKRERDLPESHQVFVEEYFNKYLQD